MADPNTPEARPPGPESLAAAFGHRLSLSTRAMHADDYVNSHPAVAPPMHVSTTFRYHQDPDKLVPWGQPDVCFFLVSLGCHMCSPPRT